MFRLAAICCLVFLLAGPARGGETRCWFEKGAVVVPAAFGDMAGDFILDLSAPKSQIHMTRAQSDGIDGPAAVRDLTLAGERVPALVAEVVDLDARTRDFVTSIVGVIGADVAGRFVVDIQFSPCRVAFWRRASRLRGGVRLNVIRAAGVPVVRAAISDGAKTRAGRFAIDTGAAPVMVANARLSRAPTAGASAPVRLRALTFASALFEQVPAGVLADTPPGLDGVIGTAVWSRFRMRLDLRRGWFDLAPPSPSWGGTGGEGARVGQSRSSP